MQYFFFKKKFHYNCNHFTFFRLKYRVVIYYDSVLLS